MANRAIACRTWIRGAACRPAGLGPADAAVINFESVPDPLKLPDNMYLGEVSGIARQFQGPHLRAHARQYDRPGLCRGRRELLEFGPDGKFLREIGHNLYAWSFAHTVKIDRHDNIWVTDKGSDMVIKFTPEGRVAMVFGRKQEASDEDTGPLKHPKPPLPAEPGRFRQVTDIAFDTADNTFISDGYINSRVAKADKDGNWLKSWGDRGNGPGQFNTPHSIATDNDGQCLCRRSRQSPHPGVRRRRQFQTADGDRRAGAARCKTRHRQYSKRSANRRRHLGAGLALGDLHHAGPTSGALQRRCLARPHLQIIARRQSARHAWPERQAASSSSAGCTSWPARRRT